MNKLVIVVMMMWTGLASAQPAGSGSAAATGSGSAAGSAAELRQICAQAMNADPSFASEILETLGKKLDVVTIEAHADADAHVQKNEKHVIYAYAAMWVIAAMFVLFLWRRQQALVAEIALLRRDLDAAGKESK